jgi:hypothetical protein
MDQSAASKAEAQHRITIGELKEQLTIWPDDFEITFGATSDAVPLVFYRTKQRGPRLVQIELNEITNEDLAAYQK